MKSALLSHHSSRSCRHRHAFIRQAGEQYRRDCRLPSGRGIAHWLHRRTFFLATPPGSSPPAVHASALMQKRQRSGLRKHWRFG